MATRYRRLCVVMMKKFQIAARSVVTALLESGFEKEAAMVGRLANAVHLPEDAEMALIELSTICHITYLGSVKVNHDGWLEMLSTLRSAASAEFVDFLESKD